MRKIGILTFHFADNYGAVIQCYALKKVIEECSNTVVEIINYIPPNLKYNKVWRNRYEHNLFKEKRIKFERFLAEQCDLKSKTIYNINQIDNYDVVVVGSDQVWNTSYPEYFLHGISLPKIAYAASLGFMPNNPSLNKDIIRKCVPEFKSISVREYAHVDFLKDLCGIDCECMPDPTLLLEESKWNRIVTNMNKDKSDFVFFFWLHHDLDILKGVEFANTLAIEYGYNIVHNRNDAKTYTFYNDLGDMQFEGIEDFLWYIKNAKYVVTNSYHAVIFSLIFNIPFYVLPTLRMKSRFDTLDIRFNIANRFFDCYNPLIEFDNSINWNNINTLRFGAKQSGEAFLTKALDNI